jgi:hypothetical protein
MNNEQRPHSQKIKITPEMIKAVEEQRDRFDAFRDELEARYGPEEVEKACQLAIDGDLKADIDAEVNERLEEERESIREEVLDAMEDEILVWASLILRERHQ